MGLDWFYNYAPTLALMSFRLLLALCSYYKYNIHNIYITNAFLYGIMDCVVYRDIPDFIWLLAKYKHLKDKTHTHCFRMKKSIYGLIQSAHLFNKRFVAVLKEMGFIQLKSDPCIFILRRGERKIIMDIYVDDTIIAYKSQDHLHYVLKEISKIFKFKNMGTLKYILGLHVGRYNACYWVNQESYVLRLAQKYNIFAGKRAKTPMTTNVDLANTENSPKVDSTTYRAIVGAILYVSVASRPDITYSINRLAKYSMDPREIHMESAKMLIKYLVNIAGYRIIYNKQEEPPIIQAYTDASHGSDHKTGKSITGYYVEVCGGPVSWSSSTQTVVTPSTAYAEYIAISATCRDVMAVTRMSNEIIPELAAQTFPVPIHTDSASAITIANRPGFSKLSKSIRLSYHNVRDMIQKGEIETRKIAGKPNPADILTKPLPRTDVERHTSTMFTKNKERTYILWE